MILGGLQKNSLIDYPGKVSCVCFFMGCNFDCPYCHNPDLVRKDLTRLLPVDEGELYHFLEARKGFLDGVVISGGEPTLDGKLIPLCQRIKEIGYPVKLDTNGSRPEVILNLIDQGARGLYRHGHQDRACQISSLHQKGIRSGKLAFKHSAHHGMGWRLRVPDDLRQAYRGQQGD